MVMDEALEPPGVVALGESSVVPRDKAGEFPGAQHDRASPRSNLDTGVKVHDRAVPADEDRSAGADRREGEGRGEARRGGDQDEGACHRVILRGRSGGQRISHQVRRPTFPLCSIQELMVLLESVTSLMSVISPGRVEMIVGAAA